MYNLYDFAVGHKFSAALMSSAEKGGLKACIPMLKG